MLRSKKQDARNKRLEKLIDSDTHRSAAGALREAKTETETEAAARNK